MKKNVILIFACLSLLCLAGFAFAATITLPNPLCPNGAGSDGCIDSFPKLIEKVTTYVSAVIGVLAVLMLVVSGIMFVASGGNPERANRAKKTALYAVIGLVIALAADGLITVVKEVIGVPANSNSSNP